MPTQPRSNLLLVSMIICLFWMPFCAYNYVDLLDSGLSGGDSASVIGTMIGAMMIAPFMILALLGTIFNFVAWITNRRGFALTSFILLIIGTVLVFSWGFGFVPSIILTIIAYCKMK